MAGPIQILLIKQSCRRLGDRADRRKATGIAERLFAACVRLVRQDFDRRNSLPLSQARTMSWEGNAKAIFRLGACVAVSALVAIIARTPKIEEQLVDGLA